MLYKQMFTYSAGKRRVTDILPTVLFTSTARLYLHHGWELTPLGLRRLAKLSKFT